MEGDGSQESRRSQVSDWLRKLKGFDQWDRLGGSATQTSSKAAEDFFQSVTRAAFPSAWIGKLSSQERMDFAIGPASESAALDNCRASRRSKTPTERQLRKWQSSGSNSGRFELAFVQVKSGDGMFTLNDTFPPPDEDLIYAFFDYGGGGVYITVSSFMADAFETTPSIADRYRRSQKAEDDFGRELREIWDKTPVGTRARPTYTIEVEYAKNEPPVDDFVTLLQKAGAL